MGRAAGACRNLRAAHHSMSQPARRRWSDPAGPFKNSRNAEAAFAFADRLAIEAE
jgi:hypothetical protein